jgi:hypothetical protein
LALPRPGSGLQSLPPILRMICQAAIPDYSKGSWGLSVLPRVCGIFTANTISPSPSSRQRSNRYAVHARRNLPDKELRYLRTVIVTAAVYRGFGRELPSAYANLTHFLDLPAPSTRHSVYFHFKCLHRTVFLINSRQSHFTAPSADT